MLFAVPRRGGRRRCDRELRRAGAGFPVEADRGDYPVRRWRLLRYRRRRDERMNQIGFDVVASTPGEFGSFMRDEVARWAAVVQKGGIQPD